jgi:ribosome biogenesis GTPase
MEEAYQTRVINGDLWTEAELVESGTVPSYEEYKAQLKQLLSQNASAEYARLKAQVLAVNFDTLFFAIPSNDARSAARLERFLAIAEASGCLSRVTVLFTKSDLAEVGAELPPLPSDVKSVAVSSITGDGLDAVREYVRPRATVAFIGPSGAGKSSLVNALAGEEWMATGEIQEWSGKGRHTTTSRELVMLPCGAMALDTPGLREIGVFGEDGFELKGRLGGTHRWR